ncbi:hypothetical protein ACP3P8_05090 [Pseudomonas aeruginosa]
MARRFALEGARVVLLEKHRHPLRCQQGQQRDPPYRFRRATRQHRTGLHAGGLSRIPRHPCAPQPAAAGNRRPGGGMERRGSGAPAGHRRAGPRQRCR